MTRDELYAIIEHAGLEEIITCYGSAIEIDTYDYGEGEGEGELPRLESEIGDGPWDKGFAETNVENGERILAMIILADREMRTEGNKQEVAT